jgi:hypothetical protein
MYISSKEHNFNNQITSGEYNSITKKYKFKIQRMTFNSNANEWKKIIQI